MRRLRAGLMRIAGLFAGRRDDRELEDELASHLDMHIEDNLRLGLSPEEAQRQALTKLGGLQATKQRYKDRRGIPALEDVVQDVSSAVRTFQRSPGFTSVALVTIALGVAGPTIMFAMTSQWILEPLPFSHPDDLIDLRNLDKVTGNYGPINPVDFLDWQREAQSFEDLAAYRRADVRLTGGERAERMRGAHVTPNFFGLLGTHAAAGRVFETADGSAPSAKVALISHTMWRRRFSNDAAIVGSPIRLDNDDYTLVGVLPEDFQFTLLGAVDVWMPLAFPPEETTNRRPRSIIGIGRLRASRTVEEARSELTSLAERLARTFPETNARRSVRVLRMADEVRLHHDAGIVVPVLFAMMCCVLLVACVNVTNVMFARTSTRRQEVALRLALGASRARIIRQSLVEHLVLFVAASAIGAALAMYGTDWVTRSIPPENRQYLRNYAVLTIDDSVLAFALAVGAVCGALFGWLPARTSARADLNVDLRDGSARISGSKGGARLRAAFVISEVALALALLVSAGLLVATAPTRDTASGDAVRGAQRGDAGLCHGPGPPVESWSLAHSHRRGRLGARGPDQRDACLTALCRSRSHRTTHQAPA